VLSLIDGERSKIGEGGLLIALYGCCGFGISIA